MAVQETSLIAYEQLKKWLSEDEYTILNAIGQLGPCHDLQILEYLNIVEVYKVQQQNYPKSRARVWKINSVTGRRNQLVNLGAIYCLGKFRGIYKNKEKVYLLYRAPGDSQEPIGWTYLGPAHSRPAPPDSEPSAKQRAIQAICEKLNREKQEQLNLFK